MIPVYSTMEKGKTDMTRQVIQDDITIAKEFTGASYMLDESVHLRIRIPLKDIRMVTNNFRYGNSFNQGVFGRVYRGQLSYNGEMVMVAVKRFDRRFKVSREEFLKEIKMVSGSKHENIVSLLGFCDERGERILVFTLYDKILDMYVSSIALTWTQRLKICIGVARGLYFLHGTRGEVHSVIRSSNILVDDNWNAKILDFDLDKFAPPSLYKPKSLEDMTDIFDYRDPRYRSTGILRKESDIYSFGLVLFEVLCGRLFLPKSCGSVFVPELVKTFYKENKMHAIILDGLRDHISAESLEKFSAIAYQCLSEDHKERPPAAKIVAELEIALQCQEDAVDKKHKDDPTNGGEDESVLKKKN